MKKLCTVYVDGKLWTNVVDDMNSTSSWGVGGIIFLSKRRAQDFVRHLREYDEWEKSEIEIKGVSIS